MIQIRVWLLCLRDIACYTKKIQKEMANWFKKKPTLFDKFIQKTTLKQLCWKVAKKVSTNKQFWSRTEFGDNRISKRGPKLDWRCVLVLNNDLNNWYQRSFNLQPLKPSIFKAFWKYLTGEKKQDRARALITIHPHLQYPIHSFFQAILSISLL